MPESDFSPETEHLTINNRAYDHLFTEAVNEVMECLFVNEAPSDLTMKKVRDHISIFAGATLEPWIREIGVIKHKPDSLDASSNQLRQEYRKLVRVIRQTLKDQLMHTKERVWRDARARMVNEAGYAVFRVTQSTVHLHRLTINREYKHYGAQNRHQ
jgi:hypothetical protein